MGGREQRSPHGRPRAGYSMAVVRTVKRQKLECLIYWEKANGTVTQLRTIQSSACFEKDKVIIRRQSSEGGDEDLETSGGVLLPLPPMWLCRDTRTILEESLDLTSCLLQATRDRWLKGRFKPNVPQMEVPHPVQRPWLMGQSIHRQCHWLAALVLGNPWPLWGWVPPGPFLGAPACPHASSWPSSCN